MDDDVIQRKVDQIGMNGIVKWLSASRTSNKTRHLGNHHE